jgi:gamma-glutamyl phosphate reductase
MPTYIFEEARVSLPYKVICSGCGKKLIRKAVVTHTVNPFNKNADGSVKNYREVHAGARAAAQAIVDAKNNTAIICGKCEGN